ncbi:MAG: right-handed parallel beta-helix repeat-containing protein [Desulfarculaceae bacterium]
MNRALGIIILMMLALAASPAMAASYYVSPQGSDSNPGSASLPWASIQRGADVMGPGDVLYLRGGVYSEQVIPKNSGTPDNYITFAAYAGEEVTIDGAGLDLSDGQGLVQIIAKSFIRVEGLRLINAGPASNACGIYIGGASHIEIVGNHTHNTTSSGIGVWDSEQVRIIDNQVSLACNGGEQEYITVAGTIGFEIRGNLVHEGGDAIQGGEGIDAKDGSAHGVIAANHVYGLNRLGIYVDAWDEHTFDIEVSGNLVHDCAGDGISLASEQGGLLEDIRVMNNIAYGNQFLGLSLSAAGDAPSHPMSGLYIINNTFYDNGRGQWGGGIDIENAEVSSVVIHNNIFSANLSFQVALEPGVPLEQVWIAYNLFDGFWGYDGEILGTDFVLNDPWFLDPSTGDFHLESYSPAVDAGYPLLAPGIDFDGRARPWGRGWDLGALEYSAS